ncbi:MAG TPA: metallophosphoesterase [Bryobacteraceae bacterium]|nr:metallophosphoesterase [Bryobacteraceae bacterium]
MRQLRSLLAVSGLALYSWAQPAPKIVGGPYTVNAGPRSATVMWVVETGQASVGLSPEGMKPAPVLHAEKITFSGLRPGNTYYYQAFPGPDGKGSFHTPPAGEASFEFVVYGDTRTRHEVHRQVIQGILKYSHPDFLVNTGDLVEDGSDSSLWPVFFDIERELLRKAPIFPTPGNHEHNSSDYYELMSAKPYYSFDWGRAHFSLIDSDLAGAGGTPGERDSFWRAETAWLEDDLKNSQNAAFRFVVAHHPPMTAVRARQGANPHMTALEPMLEKYKVTAGLFGHDHNYQHYLLRGVHYFISGGGGAPLYDVDLPPAGITQKVETTENFLVVRVSGGKASIEAMKPSGERIDSAELR